MNQYDFYAHKPSANYHKSDIWFLISVLLLWGLGMFTIFVCSQGYAARFFNNDSFYFVKRQLVCSVAGIVLFIAFLLLDMETIKKTHTNIKNCNFVNKACTTNKFEKCICRYRFLFKKRIYLPQKDKGGLRQWLERLFVLMKKSATAAEYVPVPAMRVRLTL